MSLAIQPLTITDINGFTDSEYKKLFGMDKPPQEMPKRYKIYHDGGHYIAQQFVRSSTSQHGNRPKDTNNAELNMFFEQLYFNAVSEGFKGNDIKHYVRTNITTLFDFNSEQALDDYVEKRFERVISNMHKRFKLFRRKANLNRWTHFVTITYNDLLHTEDIFRRKLRKCLSNLHTRRGWRYMGVFERAPETGRLHFHGIICIPHGEMIGSLSKKQDYNKNTGTMQITNENSFFLESYGRNDFKEVNGMNSTINYILKYISKTNERIVYSRHIPAQIFKELNESELACEMFDFVQKFVLFDDVVDWERDVMRFLSKQMTLIDYICNPPC